MASGALGQSAVAADSSYGSSQGSFRPSGQARTSSNQSSSSPSGAPGSDSAYGGGAGSAYASYQATTKRRAPIGWWLGAAALLLVLVLVGVFVVRGLSGGDVGTPTRPNAQPSENTCPPMRTPAFPENPGAANGRVRGGPLSYPLLGSPWSVPRPEFRVPFGVDVQTQSVLVQKSYAPGSDWVASVLVGELQAGDGFFTPQQGSQVVVKCVLGTFYGDAEVQSKILVNQAGKVDGNDSWTVEAQLTFDIPNLVTKGELLIITIVSNGATAGLFYASIPDTVPELVQPARDALKGLRVEG
jgi:hypothetical protein